MRALFLDRDGVINQERSYIWRAEDFHFVDGIFSLCRTAVELGYRLIVVTKELTEWMRGEFRREGIELDAVYHCPFHPEHGIGVYKQEHEDRKPSPGMLRRGAVEFGVALEQSVMVGDRCTDVGAANAAGLRQAFLLRGTEDEDRECDGSFIAVDALREVEAWLLARG